MPLAHVVKGIFFVCLVLLADNAKGQLWDSIAYHLSHKPKLDARLNGRSSFVSETPAKLVGIQIGLTYNKRVKWGLGFNQLKNEVARIKVVDGEEQIHLFQASTFMPYFEYVFYNRKRWEALVTVQAGLGNSWYTFEGNRRGHAAFAVYEPHMTGIWLPWDWIGFGFGVGYSLTLPGKTAIGEQLSAPLYLGKVAFRPFELFK